MESHNNKTSLKNCSRTPSSSPFCSLTEPLKKSLPRLTIFIFLAFSLLLLASFIIKLSKPASSHARKPDQYPSFVLPSPSPPLRSVIKKTCASTLYPSLCFKILSSFPPTSKNPSNNNTFHHILEFSINQTMRHVTSTRSKILDRLSSRSLNSQENNAVDDCMEMLDQTLYELRGALVELHSLTSSATSFRRRYGIIKTLLSAAMTNENTCIDGFSELEQESDQLKGIKGLKQDLQKFLTPTLRMISNCLAIIKYIETKHPTRGLRNPRQLTTNLFHDNNPTWMTSVDRMMMETESRMRPRVTVASNGSGDFTTIGDAINMAPNSSLDRYLIQIKAGIYMENVIIPRNKVNIMLVGDGMNSTVIIGSKNFVDGFSTFTSATMSMLLFVC